MTQPKTNLPTALDL
uniref:Uncharacterized protein n=1 Tax=Arundo donax TaxID=35708 RepID=A0A0A8YQM3_ARUDO